MDIRIKIGPIELDLHTNSTPAAGGEVQSHDFEDGYWIDGDFEYIDPSEEFDEALRRAVEGLKDPADYATDSRQDELDAERFWLNYFEGQTVEKINAGADVSPAGLVVGGPRSEENDVADKLTRAQSDEDDDLNAMAPAATFEEFRRETEHSIEALAAQAAVPLSLLYPPIPDYAADTRLVDLVARMQFEATGTFADDLPESDEPWGTWASLPQVSKDRWIEQTAVRLRRG